MALLFLGGFTLMIGVLLDAVPLITLNLPFEIIAIGIFLRRNWASLRTVGWGEGRPPPFLAAATVAVIWNLGMLIYLISKYADDFDAAPDRLLLALDHTMFIGVLTNALFAQLLAATRATRRDLGLGRPGGVLVRQHRPGRLLVRPGHRRGVAQADLHPLHGRRHPARRRRLPGPSCRPTANRPPNPPAPDR